MEPDDRLQTVRVYSVDLAYDTHLDILGVFFRDSHVGRRVVFLVTHEDVRHKGTLTGQKGDG